MIILPLDFPSRQDFGESLRGPEPVESAKFWVFVQLIFGLPSPKNKLYLNPNIALGFSTWSGENTKSVVIPQVATMSGISYNFMRICNT